MIRYLSIVLLLAIFSGSYAQKPNDFPQKSTQQIPDSLKSRLNTIKSQKQDSVKKPRIMREWNLSDDFSEEVITNIDTAFSLSHRSRIADKYSPINATLGNYGLPFYQMNFFDRVRDPDNFLYSSYYPLMHLPANAVFMNSTKPYTELDWSYAGKRESAEQTFRVMHSQNVNRKLNIGLIYDIVFSLGQYNFQKASDKTFTIFTSYTGDRYKLYFSAGINNLYSNENGGIANMSDLANTNQSTLDILTNLGTLNNAISKVKNRNVLLVQRYTIGSAPGVKKDSTSREKPGFLGLSGTFSHIFIYEKNIRRYRDENPVSGFYDSIFMDSHLTYDSIYSRSIKNTIRFDFTTDETRKFRLGGGVGIRNELLTFYHIIPVPYFLQPETPEWHKNNNVLIGKLYNNIGNNFLWLATGELFLTGYRAGDFNLKGEINKSFNWKKGKASWLINGSMANTQPSFWYDQWGSNNFRWQNNFTKEFRIDVGTAFRYPGRKAELKFNYGIIKNYVDFDTTAFPSQLAGPVSVAALTLSKDLRLWKFHLNSDVILQKSSHPEIIDLPLFALRTAGYFEHLFRFASTGGKLYAQLGADLIYNSQYHGYNYMPATGVFYRQENISVGDYPYINLFLNLKIKRTRLYLMFDHVNQGLNINNTRYNYFMVPSYPMNIRMFRFGFSWTFYD